MAAVLNAASNAINQIYDLEIDRINKPKRPLPSGRLTIAEAWSFTLVTYVIALTLAWLVAPGGRHECFWIVLVATAITVLYSVPPFRTKRLGIWANVTIAIPRGVLLKVAGWSAVKTVMAVEPWFIGGIFGLFLLGASTTKDFADMEGDARGGCRTLPIIYGVRRAAWMISPSFVVPFLMIAVGALTGILTGNFVLLLALSAGMTAYGLYVCYLMLRRPEELAVEENHVSWAHMYRMMFVAQTRLRRRLPLIKWADPAPPATSRPGFDSGAQIGAYMANKKRMSPWMPRSSSILQTSLRPRAPSR